MSHAFRPQGVTETAETAPVVVRTPVNAQRHSGTLPAPSAELEFIPIEEVARKLGGVCLRTIRRLSDAGELCKPVKVGGRSMYPKQEVFAYMLRKMRERPR
jgi:hypothetical protein